MRNGSTTASSTAAGLLRLFPALAVLLVVFVALSWTLPAPIDNGTRLGALTSGLYVSNIFGVLAAPPGGLLWHTWSLSIEEQFYLVWPIVLHLSLKRGSVIRTIASAAAAMAALRVLSIAVDVPLGNVYAFTFTRADAILVGCLAAYLVRRDPGLVARLRPWTPFAISVMLLMFVAADRGHEITYEILLPLFALTAGVFIIGVMHEDSRLQPLLTKSWLRRVGRLSYGLYLWHVPVIKYTQFRWPEASPMLAVPLALLASWLLAEASWRIIETPFLRLKDRSRNAVREPALTPGTA